MKETADVTAVVVDHGIFLPIARRLARDFRKVYYFSPSEKAFPTVRDCIGDGFDDIERVDDIWKVKTEADLFVFPDIGFAGEQRELMAQGKPVWDAGDADSLETMRGKFLNALITTDLPVPGYQKIVGLSSLREHLRDKPDKYIKLSRFRGDWETMHWRDWDQDELELDRRAVKLGPWKDVVPFYVFDPIPTDNEDGCDTWCIDGRYPSLVIHGMEAKDKAYLGAFQKFDDLPEEVRKVNDAFGPILAGHNYRSFFSTEVRITEDGQSYFIDPTCFSDDTEVLTNQGWKRFQDLDNTERICTLNPETSRIEYHHPTGYVSHHFDGQLVRISNRSGDVDLLVTPNHSVWGRPKHKLFLQEFPADKIPYSLSIPRTGIWEGIVGLDFILPAYSKTWHSGKGRGIDKTFCKSRLTVAMDVWLRFLALYLAEGSSRQWQTTIWQTKHKDRVREILKSTPFVWKEHAKGFTCSDVQLCACLSSLGNRYTKAIPAFVGQLQPRQINLFLDAYCLGDGHLDNGNRIISTPSKQTADDLQELFLKAGSVASVVLRKFKGKPCAISEGKYTCHHDSYEVRERRQFVDFYVEGWKNPRHSQYLSRVPYEGMVHDVTVPNHIIYVRRNGKCCWSGNCRAGSPPSQVMCEMVGNLGEVVWRGAQGELVEPDVAAKFGVQAIVNLKHGPDWRVLELPDALDRWFKPGPCTRINKRLCFPPDTDNPSPDVGWLIGIGDFPEEAIKHLEHNIKLLPEGATCEYRYLADLLEQVAAAEAKGMEFSDTEMPGPEVVEKTDANG